MGTSPADARFVPPPPEYMVSAMGDLEEFFYSNRDIPALIKVALIRSQFETIHPFIDGNGRVGRLLVTLYLCQEKVLEKPVLYLSEYFRKHREAANRLAKRFVELGLLHPREKEKKYARIFVYKEYLDLFEK